MIRYRRLYESEESDIQLYDIVSCCGYDWYVINVEGDIVTLLAKDNDFGKSKFDDTESNDYKARKIREDINNRVLLKVQSANPLPTRLDDIGVIDKVFLLSIDEAKRLPREVRQFPNWWLLRSCGGHAYDEACVDIDGGVNDDGISVNYVNYAVRPAMRVRIEDLEG
jgi:hypothetical protein